MLVSSMTTRWNNGFAALIENGVHQVIGIVGAVGDDMPGGKAIDKAMRLRHIVLLAGPGKQTHRIAQRVDGGVELGA